MPYQLSSLLVEASVLDHGVFLALLAALTPENPRHTRSKTQAEEVRATYPKYVLQIARGVQPLWNATGSV